MGVFLTEHPHFLLGAVGGQRWRSPAPLRGSYPEATKMKTRQQNEPNVQYLIEVRVPVTGYVVDRFTIEQVEVGSKAGARPHPNYNTVQVHLDALSSRTGLEYEIVAWGGVMDVSHWVDGEPLRA